MISRALFDANRGDHGNWIFAAHLHPSSARDGGLTRLVSTVEEHLLEQVQPESSQPPTAERTSISESGDEELHAQCHCGGVSFTISRPREDVIPGWTSPVNRTKWLASIALCDDCRLTTGTHAIGWMFVPLDHISPIPPKDLMIGSSHGYRSAEDVLRTFCGTCGATVFYSCAERPRILNVAVGILRASEGVMVERWAVWRAGRAAWPENGMRHHAGFNQALIDGLKQWGIERGQP